MNRCDAATVDLNFDGTFFHFSFGIPRADKGDIGEPGEATTQQLTDTVAAATAGTARNPSGIGPYTGDISDPPTQQEMRDYRDYQESWRQAMLR